MISELIINYLLIIILNFIFLITAFSFGLASQNLISININKKNQILWVGIISLSIILMLVHFFFSISFYINIFIFISSIIYLLYFKKNRVNFIDIIKTNKITIIFYFFCLIILTKSSLFYDTGLYHIQNIKWFTEYSLIPGLANLNDRFGFNIISYYLSNYFIYPHTLNLSYISASLFIYTLTFSTIINFNFQNFDKAKWLKIILLIGLGFKRYLVPSASPDLIVFCLELVIIGTLIDYIFSKEKNNNDLIFILICLCFIFYFKISSIIFSFLFILILNYLYREKIFEKVNYKIIIFILFPLTVWIIRGYILSGMPFYPNSLLIINSFDFSVEKDYADTLVKNIYNWSINKNINSDIKISYIDNFIYWFKNIIDYQKLYLLIIISLLTLIFLNFKKEIFSKTLVIITIAFIANICFVLVNLPQVRFLESSLIGLILLLTIFFYEAYKNVSFINNVILNKIINFSATIFFIIIVFFKGDFNNTFSLDWNSSKTMKNQNFKLVENNRNYKVFMPISGDQCWDKELPCTFYLNQNLTLKKFKFLSKDFFYFTIK